MDLLSTVLHELGNAMGFAEDNGQDVTGMTLAAGIRRLPTGEPVATADATLTTGADLPTSQQVLGHVAAPAIADAATGPLTTGVVPGLVVAAAPPAGPLSIPYPNLAGNGAAPPAANRLLSGNLAGSFVTLGSGAPVNAPPAGEDAAGAGQQGSRANPSATPNGAGAAVIAWNAERNAAVDGLASGTSQDWLDDFLNHLGQNETQWNPNAGIRVRPTAAAA